MIFFPMLLIMSMLAFALIQAPPGDYLTDYVAAQQAMGDFMSKDDEEALRESVKEAKKLGFDGKGCIHPRQIKPIHEEFAPSESEIEKAKKIGQTVKDATKVPTNISKYKYILVSMLMYW